MSADVQSMSPSLCVPVPSRPSPFASQSLRVPNAIVTGQNWMRTELTYLCAPSMICTTSTYPRCPPATTNMSKFDGKLHGPPQNPPPRPPIPPPPPYVREYFWTSQWSIRLTNDSILKHRQYTNPRDRQPGPTSSATEVTIQPPLLNSSTPCMWEPFETTNAVPEWQRDLNRGKDERQIVGQQGHQAVTVNGSETGDDAAGMTGSEGKGGLF